MTAMIIERTHATIETKKLFLIYCKNPTSTSTLLKFYRVGAWIKSDGVAVRISVLGFSADRSIHKKGKIQMAEKNTRDT